MPNNINYDDLNRTPTPEETAEAKELRLIYAEAKMYAAMTEATLLRSLSPERIREALLSLASEEDRERLKKRQDEVENIRQCIMQRSFNIRFEALDSQHGNYRPALDQTPNPITQLAYNQAHTLQKHFDHLLEEFGVSNELEIEAGIMPPLGLAGQNLTFELRRKYLKDT